MKQILILLLFASCANAQIITLDTVYVQNMGGTFFEISETRFSDNSSAITTKAIGSDTATLIYYSSALQNMAAREAVDLAALGRLRNEKNKLVGVVEKVKLLTGGSPVDSLKLDENEFVGVAWYISSPEFSGPIVFDNTNSLKWTAGTFNGNVVFLGQTLRLQKFTKPNLKVDLYRKEGYWISSDLQITMKRI